MSDIHNGAIVMLILVAAVSIGAGQGGTVVGRPDIDLVVPNSDLTWGETSRFASTYPIAAY